MRLTRTLAAAAAAAALAGGAAYATASAAPTITTPAHLAGQNWETTPPSTAAMPTVLHLTGPTVTSPAAPPATAPQPPTPAPNAPPAPEGRQAAARVTPATTSTTTGDNVPCCTADHMQPTPLWFGCGDGTTVNLSAGQTCPPKPTTTTTTAAPPATRTQPAPPTAECARNGPTSCNPTIGNQAVTVWWPGPGLYCGQTSQATATEYGYTVIPASACQGGNYVGQQTGPAAGGTDSIPCCSEIPPNPTPAPTTTTVPARG